MNELDTVQFDEDSSEGGKFIFMEIEFDLVKMWLT